MCFNLFQKCYSPYAIDTTLKQNDVVTYYGQLKTPLKKNNPAIAQYILLSV